MRCYIDCREYHMSCYDDNHPWYHNLILIPIHRLIRPMVAIVGYLASGLGLDIPALGIRSFPFGSAMVTSVGMLGVEQGFIP